MEFGLYSRFAPIKAINYFKESVLLKTVLVLVMVLGAQVAFSQTLKTDEDIPPISACGPIEEFSVRVGRGATALNGAALTITMPEHFHYVPGSAKVDGIAVSEAGAGLDGTTITFDIPAGGPDDDLVITYEVRAACAAIGSSNLPVEQRPQIEYELDLGGTDPLTGVSEAINIRYAVLNLTVSPPTGQRIQGGEVSRTVTVRNNGNGTITEFMVESNLGDGLSLVSSMPATIGDWTVTETAPGVYHFSGSTLQSGDQVSFDETVLIENCEDDLSTSYEAYYGCDDKCELGNANASNTANIAIDNSIRPNLTFTLEQGPNLDEICFDTDFTYIYKISNTGTGDAANILLNLGTHASIASGYGSTHYLDGSFELSETADFSTTIPVILGATDTWPASQGVHFGTTGRIYSQDLEISELASGQEIYVRFTLRHASPNQELMCTTFPDRVLYGTLTRSMTYEHANHCGAAPQLSLPSSTMIPSRDYHVSGYSTGDVDAIDGVPFKAEYSLTSFRFLFQNQGFQPGDYVDMVVNLSPSLAASVTAADISLMLDGVDITPTIIDAGSGVFHLRFEHGSSLFSPIYDLNLARAILQFDATMDCNAGTDAWYQVGAEVHKAACGTTTRVACNTIPLKAFCVDGTCPVGGLERSAVTLKRLTYGYAANNPDNIGKPVLPLDLLDPDALPAGVRSRTYTTGDVVEVSQVGTVSVTSLSPGNVPTEGWSAGRFRFNIPSNHNAALVNENSGTLVFTRGADTWIMDDLPVTLGGNQASLDFDIALLHAQGLPAGITSFEDGDELRAAIPFRVSGHTMGNNVAHEFTPEFAMMEDSQPYSCGVARTAVGLSTSLATFFNNYTSSTTDADGYANLVDCGSRPYAASFRSLVAGISSRNASFMAEYRQHVFPKKAIFNVPAGLEMTGVYVQILGQGTTYNVTMPVSVTGNPAFEMDLEPVIADLIGDGPYLDEGFEIRIFPNVNVNCDAADREVIEVAVVFDGTTRLNSTNYVDATDVQTPFVPLRYNTGVGTLSAHVQEAATVATTDHAQWVIQVTNSSDFRVHSNVWLGRAGGAASSITSVQQVTGFNDLTPIGGLITDTDGDGIFELGSITVGTTAATGNRYYLISAPVAGCDEGDLEIIFGASCAGYPTSASDPNGCAWGTERLTYTHTTANLQTEIVSQNSASVRPELCEDLEYIVRVHNAGEGAAYDLFIDIPLTSAEGLTYVPGSLEITSIFTGGTSGAFESIDDDVLLWVDETNSSIRIRIPQDVVEVLPSGHRFDVKFKLNMGGCDFRSGQRIAFYPGGVHGCGSDVLETTGAASNRVTIAGAPTNLAEVEVETEVALVDYVEVENDDLTALYSLTFTNVGDGVNNFEIDQTYLMNIKLPENWEFVAPADLVDPNLLEYDGFDAAKGYLYRFVNPLTVDNSVTIVDALLRYTGDAAALACDEDFGLVLASVYTTFQPTTSHCDPALVCDIEQVVMNSEAPLVLTLPPTPTADEDDIAFCETEGATIADLTAAGLINEAGIVIWYDVSTGGTALDATDLLATGTYYAVLRDGATGCESGSRLAIEVEIDEEPVAEAGPDQAASHELNFTLEGNAPTGGGTGEWTFVSGTDAEGNPLVAADVTIVSPTAHNTSVTLPEVGSEVVLRWTLNSKNNVCSDFDDVTITSLRPELTLMKGVASYTDNGDGRHSAGDILTYKFTVINSGDVPISGPIAITDPQLGWVNHEVQAGDLPVGASFTVGPDGSTEYTITLVDMDAGFTLNSALVRGEDTLGGLVTDVSDTETDPSGAPILDPMGSDEDGDGDPTNDPTVYDLNRLPSVDLIKSSVYTGDADRAEVGDEIEYTFVVTNTGNVTLHNVSVDETVLFSGSDAVPALSAPVASSASSSEAALEPGATLTYTATYAITQADIDAGEVVNQALVSGTPPGATDPIEDLSDDPDDDTDVDPDNDGNPDDPTVTPLPQAPLVDLIKSSVYTGDADRAEVGDEIEYTFVVTNTGNVTLYNVSVDETVLFSGSDAVPALSAPVASSVSSSEAALEPGATLTYTATYAITQADIDAGEVVNQALVSGTPPGATDPIEDLSDDPDDDTDVDPDGDGNPDDPTVTPLPQLPLVELTKEAIFSGDPNRAEVDDEIEYTFVVTNTGNVTLHNVSVDDTEFFSGTGAALLLSAPVATPATSSEATLEPGATLTYTATYAITQADIDAGEVINQARVSGTPPGTTDPIEDLSDDPNDPTDVDPDGDGNPDDPTVVPLGQDPLVEITKEGVYTGDPDRAEVGDIIEYTFIVTNTGNVTLSDVDIDEDSLFEGFGVTPVLSAPVADPATSSASAFAPYSTLTYTAAYAITQEDIDLGMVVNQAIVSGTPPGTNTPIEDHSDDPNDPTDVDPDGDGNPDDPTIIPLPQDPLVDLVKSSVYTGDPDRAEVGDIIEYTFVVTNTGNVTLDNVVIDETMFSGSGTKPVLSAPVANPATSSATALAPYATLTYTARYAITQSDINAGEVINQARVRGTPPGTNTPIEDHSDDPNDPTDVDPDGDGNPDDPTVTPLPKDPLIDLKKSAVYTGDVSEAQVGDVINYTFVLTNTGNVTLNNVSIQDEVLFSGTGVKPVLSAPLGNPSFSTESVLQPYATLTYTASYAITQADIDAGHVTNQALASGTPPDTNTPIEDHSDDPNDPTDVDPDGDGNPDDPTVVDLGQNPILELFKSGVYNDLNQDGFAQPGETITYTFIVHNRGNVPVTDLVIDDARIGVSSLPVTPGSLAPGEQGEASYVYTITQRDIDEGGVWNIATVTGKDPKGEDVIDESEDPTPLDPDDDDYDAECPDCTVTPLPQGPEYSINKMADKTTVSQAGEVITYTIRVTNTGNVTLQNLVVTDVLFPGWSGQVETLAPQATKAFELTYTVTQADIDAGSILNVAIVNGEGPDGDPLDPEEDEEEVPVSYIPGITVTKSADKTSVLREGEVITYTIVVKNTGNTTLKNVTVVDPLTNFSQIIAEMAVGEEKRFTTSYTVTAADLQLEVIINVVKVTGEDPTGTPVEDEDEEKVPVESRPFKIPNIFTPNGDGINDVFEIEGIEGFDRVEVLIFNRWGNEVYRSTNYRNDWAGLNLNEGVYYYMINTYLGNISTPHKGWVVLKRN